MKQLAQYVKDSLTKIEFGEAGTRAYRLSNWKASVTLELEPLDPQVSLWWQWCCEQAEHTYDKFLATSIQKRATIWPTVSMPLAWRQIDVWMRPKLLAAIPNHFVSIMKDRTRISGIPDPTHVILYHMLKEFAPGSPQEKDNLYNGIRYPNVCTSARSALLSLGRWKENVRRCA